MDQTLGLPDKTDLPAAVVVKISHSIMDPVAEIKRHLRDRRIDRVAGSDEGNLGFLSKAQNWKT